MKKIINVLNKIEGDVFIVGHVNPDFDSLASCYLVSEILKKGENYNKVNPMVIFEEADVEEETARGSYKYFKKYFDKCPEYGFKVDFTTLITNVEEATLVMVDICSTENRLPEMVAKNLNNFKKVIVIDHHFVGDQLINDLVDKTNEVEMFINSNEQSCAQMIYEQLNEGSKCFVTNKQLYTFGILGDTANGKFGTPKFDLDLSLELNLNKHWFTLTDAEGLILGEVTLELFKNGNYFVDFAKFEANKFVVNYGKLATYLSFTLVDQAWDLTVELEEGVFQHYLRAGSNCDVDVSSIARANGGGGHKKASGVRNDNNTPLITK